MAISTTRMKQAFDDTGFLTAEEAEHAFYRAFANVSFGEMSRVWAMDGVACIHPGGPLLVGRGEVLKSWARILSAGAPPELRYETVLVQSSGDLSTHLVREMIASAAGRETVVVQAVNAYRKQPDGWRMVLHHATPPVTRQSQGKAVPTPPEIMH